MGWLRGRGGRGSDDAASVVDARRNEHLAVARGLVGGDAWVGSAQRGFSIGSREWSEITAVRTDVIPGLTPPEVASYIVALFDAVVRQDGWYTAIQVMGAAGQRKPPFDEVDVALLFDLLLQADSSVWQWLDMAKIAIAAAERLDEPAPALQERYLRALAVIESAAWEPATRAKVRFRLLDLIRALDGGAAAGEDQGIDTLAFRSDDGWGPHVIAMLGRRRGDGPEISAVINHAATLGSPRPNKTWRRRAAELTASAPTAEPVLGDLLHEATAGPTATVRNDWGGMWETRVGSGNHDLLRGLIWCAMALDPRPDWLLPELQALSQESMRQHTKVLGASAAAIGETGDAAAVGVLVALQRSTRDRGFLKVINGALDTAAERAGMGRSELLETTVPDEGLDGAGRRVFAMGDLTATVAVDGNGKVTTAWARSGEPLKGVPADAKDQWKGELAEVKRVAAEVRKLASSERARLESLITESRSWPIRTFEARYLRHPVTTPLARHLIWWLQFGEGERVAARPAEEGWTLVDGSVIEPGDDTSVSPWHPLVVDPGDVFAWRRDIEDRAWRQPFKQAFREIYLLTPAEEETATYSNRFAAHILDYRRAFALMKERGWGANFLGGWSSGLAGEANRDFPDQGLRAVFYHDPVVVEAAGRYDDVTLCSTDQVRFETLGRGERPAVPLVDVPPMVFSEAMRDVDLFVGVTSMANDPAWGDRGADGHVDYWQRAAFGDLTATAETRRDALEHLLPKLKIAKVTSIDGRFLRVRGHDHSYKIHLGSGNILMEPNDRYLCIVSARSPSATALRFVPFDGDHTLSVILSKAFLLADDHKITDASILAQMNARR